MKNREKLLAAAAFLIAIANAFSSELSGLIGLEQVRLTRHTVFVRKEVTNAGGQIRIIDENTKKVDGVSSISETKLPKNQAQIFDKIAIGFGEADAQGEEGSVDYTASKAPAIARNASIVITQNGREVLDLPLADVVKAISPGSPEDYYHDLEGFNYLVDDQPMEWYLRLPNGKVLAPSAAGKFIYMEVRLQGFKTSRKA
ncbi:hypothetical protein RM553_12710 [Zunongwangia sp. F363]|uniref:Uncharacterized protein n=1 Tax=Autumnicola tepida TaxID=3075595 RepID=A0ABU3CBJ4_9FLAO|nr:hypothetical protein [Zunongwangia sp. F363]MDT0643696.1 hypothetical protein [Zunongwangia sp. F363]